jgi:hypothetical protein
VGQRRTDLRLTVKALGLATVEDSIASWAIRSLMATDWPIEGWRAW